MYSCRHYNFTSSSAVGYDIRVDAAPGPHGIMHQYRARIGSNTLIAVIFVFCIFLSSSWEVFHMPKLPAWISALPRRMKCLKLRMQTTGEPDWLLTIMMCVIFGDACVRRCLVLSFNAWRWILIVLPRLLASEQALQKSATVKPHVDNDDWREVLHLAYDELLLAYLSGARWNLSGFLSLLI